MRVGRAQARKKDVSHLDHGQAWECRAHSLTDDAAMKQCSGGLASALPWVSEMMISAQP